MRLKIRCLVIGEYHCETLFEHQKCTLRRMKSKWFVQFKKNRCKLTSGFLYPFIPILYDIENLDILIKRLGAIKQTEDYNGEKKYLRCRYLDIFS